jgi:hypothetical protein
MTATLLSRLRLHLRRLARIAGRRRAGGTCNALSASVAFGRFSPQDWPPGRMQNARSAGGSRDIASSGGSCIIRTH